MKYVEFIALAAMFVAFGVYVAIAISDKVLVAAV